MNDLTSIWQQEDDLTPEQVKAYLEGRLQGDALAQVERIIHDSPFIADAIDGLKSLPTADHLDEVVNTLNKKLHQQLAQAKGKRQRRKIPSLYWSIIAVVLILLLCFLGYWIVSSYF